MLVSEAIHGGLGILCPMLLGMPLWGRSTLLCPPVVLISSVLGKTCIFLSIKQKSILRSTNPIFPFTRDHQQGINFPACWLCSQHMPFLRAHQASLMGGDVCLPAYICCCLVHPCSPCTSSVHQLKSLLSQMMTSKWMGPECPPGGSPMSPALHDGYATRSCL